MNIGEYIRYHRNKSGFESMTSLAKASDLSSSTIHRIELGKQRPEVRTLKSLAPHLTSTSYENLLKAAGYNVNKMNRKKYVSIDVNIDDEELSERFKLFIDKIELSDNEIESVIAFIRTMRGISE